MLKPRPFTSGCARRGSPGGPATGRALASALLLSGMLMLPQGVRAAIGFTGSYAPANWTLYTSPNAPPNSFNPPTSCPTASGLVECVENFNNPAGYLSLYGGFALPDGVAQETTLVAPAPTDGSKQMLSFTMDFYGVGGSPDFYAYYQVQNSPKVLLTINAGELVNTLTVSNVYVQANETFTFGIYNKTQTGLAGNIDISNFEAQPVPAPLPALGAASGFAWSRRLRRRLAGRPLPHPRKLRLPAARPRPLYPAPRQPGGAVAEAQAYERLLAGPRLPLPTPCGQRCVGFGFSPTDPQA